jgi:hypothetical protein
MPNLDNRHRDSDGRISQKRGDAKLETLRRDYPALAPELPGSTLLQTLRDATGKSLSQIVKDSKPS